MFRPLVLCCRDLVSFCGVVWACCRFFPLKPPQNPFLKKNIFFEIKKNYTLPNTPACIKTMYFVLTYVSPDVGEALVFVGSYLSWSLSKLLAFIGRGLSLSPRAAS